MVVIAGFTRRTHTLFTVDIPGVWVQPLIAPDGYALLATSAREFALFADNHHILAFGTLLISATSDITSDITVCSVMASASLLHTSIVKRVISFIFITMRSSSLPE